MDLVEVCPALDHASVIAHLAAHLPFEGLALALSGAPRRGRGPALLVPPGKTASTRLVAGYVSLLLRSGHDVWLLSPPHHLERTAPGSRSGEGFVSLDLERLRAVFEQLVL